MFSFVLLVVAFAISGFIMGSLGGGGALLVVPLLVYLQSATLEQAVYSVLLIVGLISFFSFLQYARKVLVSYKAAFLCWIGGFLGSFAGVHSLKFIPEKLLILIFPILLCYLAWKMWQSSKYENRSEVWINFKKAILIIAFSSVAGLLTAWVGVSGGFIIVPSLVTYLSFPMSLAVGTSLLVIVGNVGMTFVQKLLWHPQAWVKNFPIFLLVSLLFSYLGSHLGPKTPDKILKKMFTAVALVIAALVLSRELRG